MACGESDVVLKKAPHGGGELCTGGKRGDGCDEVEVVVGSELGRTGAES